jgi:hypothetical protein
MNTSEILRKLADMIDGQQNQQTGSLGQSGAVPAQVMPKDTYDNPEPEDFDQESGLAQAPEIFLPPLQMKLELLKKATGVDNVYDEEEAEDAESHAYDELDHIKRNAGINVVAIDALGDDEPLEG